MRVQVLTYGARIAGLWVPDRTGNMVDVVAGFAQPDRWLGDNPYFNAVIGLVANRIDHARYVWEGVRYDLHPTMGATPCTARSRALMPAMCPPFHPRHYCPGKLINTTPPIVLE